MSLDPPMRESSKVGHWTRHFFYRSERVRTTWKFRIGFVALLVLTVWLTRPWWTVAVARSLVCEGNAVPSDAILVENFDPDYLVFETATRLRRRGLADRVLVPVPIDGTGGNVRAVSLAVTEMMVKMARLGEVDVVPFGEAEPISLNAARDVLAFLQRQGIHSVIVVTPEFRSRRSALVYQATLGSAGIAVTCEPVQGTDGVAAWDGTLHGVQNVAEQWLKLQYYRVYVLPFGSG